MALLSEKQLKDLAVATKIAINSPSCNFSYAGKNCSAAELEATMKNQLQELVGYNASSKEIDFHKFEQNEPLIFSLMETMVSEASMKKVEEQYKGIAEFKNFGMTEKPVFRIKVTNSSRRRALTYISRGAIAGIYDVFELAGESFEGKIFDIVGAGRISFMAFITNEITLSDIMDIILEGFNKRLIEAISEAVVGMIKNLNPYNKRGASGFSADLFDSLLQIADSYGTAPSYIYCTKNFASKLFPYTTADHNAYTDAMKTELYRNGGYLRNYKGMHPIVIIEQSYDDGDKTYSKKIMNDGICLIVPNNGLVNGKPIKIGRLGSTHMRRREQTDYSIAIEAFQSYSLAVVVDDDLFAYIDASLLQTGETLGNYGL